MLALANKVEDKNNKRKLIFQSVLTQPEKSFVSEEPVEILVGGKIIVQEKTSKLLGVTINEKETWTNQINKKGGVIPSLNQRL